MASADSPQSSHGLPHARGLGQIPSIVPDVPINSAFLALFIMGATAHIGLYYFNWRRGRAFVFNAITFAFCTTRVFATVLRMAWAVSPDNTRLASAAQIFVYAGIVILILTNLFFAQRFVRGQHPRFGWRKSFSLSIGIWALICCIAVFLLIVSVIVQTYLHDTFSQHASQQIQLFSNVVFAITAILPIPIVGISCIAKSHPTLKPKPIDNFGKGSLNRKMVIIFSSATILSIGAIYRASITLVTPTPMDAPTPWYFSRITFYIFNFTLDFLLVTLWLIVRIDAQFIIPDGAHGPMTYGNGFHFARKSISRSPIDRASTIPTPSLIRAGSWGTLRNYMTSSAGDEKRPHTRRLRTPDSRLKTPTISRPEMIHASISPDRYFRTRSRGNSFWNSAASATTLAAPAPAPRAPSPPVDPDHHNNTEDIRKFPIAINSIDLRRATAAALRAAAEEQEAAIYARTKQWSDCHQQRNMHMQGNDRFEVRSLSCYSVRSDLRPGSTTTAAWSPRVG